MLRITYFLKQGLPIFGTFFIFATTILSAELSHELTYDEDRYITAIEIIQNEETVHTIRTRYANALGEKTCLELPYRHIKIFNAVEPWQPLLGSEIPVLAVMEREREFGVTTAPEWMLRIFLIKDGDFEELPPVRGGGEVYYFKDFNDDGIMEFVNEEGHSLSSGKIPNSERVYRFDGEAYRSTAEK